jgi:hypothetical protein
MNGQCNATTVSGNYYIGTGPNQTLLCNAGLATGFAFANHAWTWTCEGFSGGSATIPPCKAIEQYCGDSTTNGLEQCDGQPGCKTDGSCTRDGPICQIGVNVVGSGFYSGDTVTFQVTGLNAVAELVGISYGDTLTSYPTSNTLVYTHIYTSGGTYTTTLSIKSRENAASTNTCQTPVTIHYCGDGTVENTATGYPSATEQCDFNNPTHGVSCDTACKWKLPTCDVTLTALANPNGALPYLNKSGSALATLSGERTAFNFTKILR